VSSLATISAVWKARVSGLVISVASKPQRGQMVELGVRNVVERHALTKSAREIGQPYTSVDLV
jgi:hypothetical protein